jgi:diguanylate cyclase (GGDEF)-like protein/PAS domain S-box-containing protein/putative nucleotidyltransferase with HDIG domain
MYAGPLVATARRLLSLDAIQDGVVVLDADRAIVDVNERFCAMVGFPRAELIGRRPPFPYWPPEAIDDIEASFRGIVSGRRREVELRYRRRDGAVVDVILTGTALGPDRGRADGYVATIKDVTERRRAEQAQRALERVATAVAADATPERVFELVAGEIAEVLAAASGAVIRYESADEGVVVGRVGIDVPVPWRFALAGSNTTAQTARTGRPSREDDFSALDDPVARRLLAGGQHSGVAVPVHVGEALWGALTVGGGRPRAFAPDAEAVLERMAALLSLALATADARSQLETRAATDPLTGLLDHRAFQERLEAELQRARRHGRPLAVALFDVDDFKPVNETRGHEAGDEILRVVARALAEGGRASEVAARLGGDEFVVLAPETDAPGALALAERVRARAAAGSAALGMPVSLSAGVCSLAGAGDGDLLQGADRALYWAKAHGRDQCSVYAPEVVADLSAAERVERLERERALTGLRVLARRADAPERPRAPHSERVAELAQALAGALGWPPDELRRIREAALLHDVGKAALADGEDPEGHCLLGARLVRDILDAEQAGWIGAHHERPDGAGYPRGLEGAAVPAGAAIIALADAVDVMTTARPDRAALTRAEALAECRRLAGAQFDRRAVEALPPALGALGGGGEEPVPA